MLRMVCDVIAAVAALFGIPAVVWGLFSNARATRSRVSQDLSSLMLQIDAVFVQHPELRRFFYDGKAVSHDDEIYPRVVSLAEMILDLMDNAATQLSRRDKYLWPAWYANLRDLYAQSPCLREHLQQHAAWYSRKLLSLLQQQT